MIEATNVLYTSKLTKSVYSAALAVVGAEIPRPSRKRVLFSSFFCLFNDAHSLGMFDMKMKGKIDDE